MCQSLYALSMTSDSSLSPASVKVRALKPAMVGKHIDARVPLAFMSRTRSCTSQQPGRSSLNEPGLKPHSSRGHPTVAAMPNGVAVLSPWNCHSSMPCSVRTIFGAWSSHLAGRWFLYMSGGSIEWSSMLTMIMSSSCMAVPLVRFGRRPKLYRPAGGRAHPSWRRLDWCGPRAPSANWRPRDRDARPPGEPGRDPALSVHELPAELGLPPGDELVRALRHHQLERR